MKSTEISHIKDPIKGTQIKVDGCPDIYSYLYENNNTVLYENNEVLTIQMSELTKAQIAALIAGYNGTGIGNAYYNLGYQLANQK